MGKKVVWTYEKCHDESLKYNSKSDFQKGNGSAYGKARSKGWINDWFVNKINPNNTWTYERCYEEASKYDTIKEFRAKSAVAYCTSIDNGWRKDYTWLKLTHGKRSNWTKDKCYNTALKCQTRTEYQHKYRSAYKQSLKNKWLDDYTWFLSEHEARSRACKGRNLLWTKEACYTEAMKYSCKQDFHKGSSGAYTSALKNGWLNDYTWFETPIVKDAIGEWSVYVYCDEENNYVYVGLSNCVRRRHRQHIVGRMKHGVRKYDNVNNYFAKIGKEIPTPIIKMDGLDKVDAQYYEDWYKKKYIKLGWNVINKAPTGIRLSSIGYQREKLTREVCYEIAKKYGTIREFQKNDVTVYNKSHRKGWFNDYTWLKRVYPIRQKAS